MQPTAPNQIQRILQHGGIHKKTHKRADTRNSCLQLPQHQNHIPIRLRRIQVQNQCTVPRWQKPKDTIPPTHTENSSQIQTHQPPPRRWNAANEMNETINQGPTLGIQNQRNRPIPNTGDRHWTITPTPTLEMQQRKTMNPGSENRQYPRSPSTYRSEETDTRQMEP